jgi:hypothetical protein
LNYEAVTPEFQPELDRQLTAMRVLVGAQAPDTTELIADHMDAGHRKEFHDDCPLCHQDAATIEATMQALDAETPAPLPEPLPAPASATKAPRSVKKVKPLNQCWCGCGRETKSKFCVGDDAKLKSILLKVARGKVEASTIPAIARAHQKEIGFARPGTEYAEAFTK